MTINLFINNFCYDLVSINSYLPGKFSLYLSLVKKSIIDFKLIIDLPVGKLYNRLLSIYVCT